MKILMRLCRDNSDKRSNYKIRIITVKDYEFTVMEFPSFSKNNYSGEGLVNDTTVRDIAGYCK